MQGQDNGAETFNSISTKETTAFVAGLQPGLTYNFEIRANSSAGFGEGTEIKFQLSEKVDASETGNGDGSTPAITATTLVASIALVVLVVVIAALLWRRIRRRKIFKLSFGLHFENLRTKRGTETEENLYMEVYRQPQQNGQTLQSPDEKVDLGADEGSEDKRDSSTLNTDTNM
jgi:hypothetical protein